MTSREQFEAWWMKGNDGLQPRSGWKELRTDDGYNDEQIDMQYEGFKAAEEIYQRQLAAVVAENDRAVKAVTVFSNVTHDITEIICDELGQERVAEIVAAYNDLGNMPNTDAYLSEVRAQGVDRLATFAGEELQRHQSVGDRKMQRKWKGVVMLCVDFAAQLRQGAAK